MKSRNFLGTLCLFIMFALPAMGQDWGLKQVINLPPQVVNANMTAILGNELHPKKMVFSNGNLFVGNPCISGTSGVVQVYAQVNNVWQLEATLQPSDNNIGFGANVAVQNNTCVVSSHNRLYVFTKVNGVWTETQNIGRTDANPYGMYVGVEIPSQDPAWIHENSYVPQQNAKYFATSIVFKDDYLFVSSTREIYPPFFSGTIYMYKKNSQTGLYVFFKKIRPSNGSTGFGEKIEVIGDELYATDYSPLSGYDYTYIAAHVVHSVNQIINSPGYLYNASFSFMNNKFKGTRRANQILVEEDTEEPSNGIFKYRLNTLVRNNSSWQSISLIPVHFTKARFGWGSGLAPFGGDFFRNKLNFIYTDNMLVASPAVKKYSYYSPTYGYQPALFDSTGIQVYRRAGNGWLPASIISVPNPPANLYFLPHFELQNERSIFVPANKKEGTDNLMSIYYFQKTAGNVIKGNVYHDKNQNCQKDANEIGKNYYTVMAEPGGSITSTDENGNYALEVGTGTYTISQVIPQIQGLTVSQTCPTNQGTHTVTFNSLGNEVSGYDFGNQVKECTFLTVDVTSRRRRCFRNQTIVKYENEGVVTANNAYITVTFPEYVIPLSSTNPWVSKVGNTYKFNVGTLLGGQVGQFTVTDSVACVPNIIGLIQCTEAKIYPKNTCASPTWSGASLEILGNCLNIAPHKGRFVLRNTGTASMQSSYKVWRGNTLILNNLLALAQGDSLVLEIPTNGENLFMQANQATGHPDGAMVSAMVLNCGNNLPTSAGSPNLQMMILPNDEYANSELDCMPIVDSFDPNDKAVSPAGITENKYVKPNTELEFKIRFQNLGTAEAVNIVVIDTLSTHLDLTTFQQMSVSHAYKLKFERVNGKQVAFWTFTNINLPAKSINEPASHGYIKFKIKHLPTIAEGTIIKNFADIYFDYNEPVRTNETAINMTDYQFPVNPIDYCSLFTQAKAGEARTICENTVTLAGNAPMAGQGTWTLVSGAGVIVEPHKPNTTVSNLGAGENVFRWSMPAVLGCAISQSTVVINRLAPTVSISSNALNNSICSTESVTFTAQVTNVGNNPSYQWKVNNQNVGTNSPTFATNTLQNQDKVSLEIEMQTNLVCTNVARITSQTIDITIKAKPAKPIVSHTALYELKSSVEGDSYAWYKDNVLITNNLPTLKVQKLGKYKVVVTQNGCSSPTSDEFVLNSEVLKNFADLVKVETYPNPTTGKFTLNITNNQGSEVTVQFYNSLGQLLTEQRVEASEDIDCKVSIDFTRYKQGVYYAKIVNQYGLQTTQKIVIQKQ